MQTLKIVFIIMCATYGSIYLYFAFKTKKPFKTILFFSFVGVVTLFIINQTSSSNIEKTSNFIVNAITIFILIIIYYIAIIIVRILLNNVAKLPILHSINGIGGAIVGVVKNMIIVLILLTLLSFYSTIGKANSITNAINNSFITKQIYNSNFITTILINIQNTKDKTICCFKK
jgi:hypothetical protein